MIELRLTSVVTLGLVARSLPGILYSGAYVLHCEDVSTGFEQGQLISSTWKATWLSPAVLRGNQEVVLGPLRTGEDTQQASMKYNRNMVREARSTCGEIIQ